MTPTPNAPPAKFHLLHPTLPLIVVVRADVAQMLMKLGYRHISKQLSDMYAAEEKQQ